MRPELESIFETKIADVAYCASSIFSREDVIIILKTVRQYIDELPETTSQPENGYSSNEILATVKTIFDDYDFEQYIEVDPEISGAYGSSYSLELNIRFDETQFIRDLLCELPDHLEPNK
jgi:hypothetical protein